MVRGLSQETVSGSDKLNLPRLESLLIQSSRSAVNCDIITSGIRPLEDLSGNHHAALIRRKRAESNLTVLQFRPNTGGIGF